VHLPIKIRIFLIASFRLRKSRKYIKTKNERLKTWFFALKSNANSPPSFEYKKTYRGECNQKELKKNGFLKK